MGAVTGLIARWLPADVPIELLVGWAVWLLGGLLLMLWFTRRSGASHVPAFKPVSSSAVAAKKPGIQPVARPPSGIHGAARPTSGVNQVARTSTRHDPVASAPVTYSAPKSNTPLPDAYSELSLLLDSVDDQSHSNS